MTLAGVLTTMRHDPPMLSFLRRNYLSIDPRTLGLFRIGIACLLFLDLAKRVPVVRLFYVNSGLIPNHRVLWRPQRDHVFSFLLALSELREVQVAFALIALVYLCLLLGFRTRLMHVLSWLSLISLQVRADILSSGADFVFAVMVLWSAFLPLGRRFSVDSVLRSLRTETDRDMPGLRSQAQAARDTQPVVSLAVLALITQLAVIYFFNTVHKNGPAWHDGSAVYWLLRQERIVTALGLWAREALPLWVFQGLSYSTLIIEGALPLLILSPWGRPWTRRLALLNILVLHTGMAMMSNLGIFSPVMMVYALCFVEPRDWALWERWGRKARPVLRLAVDASCGLCFQMARVWTRLDLFGRIDVHALAPEDAAADNCGWVQAHDGPRYGAEPALRKLLGVLPMAAVWVALAQLLRPFTGPLARWVGRNRGWITRELALLPARKTAELATPSAEAFRTLRRIGFWATQLMVLALMLVATSQVLVENPSIPAALRLHQPGSVRAAVDYFRLSQGWSMFAPDVPRRDLWVVVDAVTVDDRRIDPWNDLASRVSDPSLRTIPARLAQDAAYCDYTVAIPANDAFHEPFRAWILNHHRRTHRPQDRIKHFKAYVIEQDNPAPGTRDPSNVHARVFLRD